MPAAAPRSPDRPDDQPRGSAALAIGIDAPASGLTRGGLLRTVVGAGSAAGVAVALLGLPRVATSAPSATQDRAILAFALLLEQVQLAFYARALDRLPLRGELRQFARTAHAHEQAHADWIERALGGAARPAPAIDVEEATADVEIFRATASGLEEIVVGGYNGQATNLTPAALRDVARIVSVEARHAGWARAMAETVPAPAAVDPLRSERATRSSLDELGLGLGRAP